MGMIAITGLGPLWISHFAALCLTDYEDRAKSSVTNRLPKFYPRYILNASLHLNGVLNS